MPFEGGAADDAGEFAEVRPLEDEGFDDDELVVVVVKLDLVRALWSCQSGGSMRLVLFATGAVEDDSPVGLGLLLIVFEPVKGAGGGVGLL